MDSGLTDNQYRVLINYIRDLADRMGLRDWQFFVERGFISEELNKLASTSVWGDSKTTTVEFAKSFFSLGPNMQREVIVHELTHWHLEPAWRLMSAIVKDHLSHDAANVMRTAYEQHMELSVDAIAAAWAWQFPLINWKSTAKLYSEARRERPPEGKRID